MAYSLALFLIASIVVNVYQYFEVCRLQTEFDDRELRIQAIMEQEADRMERMHALRATRVE